MHDTHIWIFSLHVAIPTYTMSSSFGELVQALEIFPVRDPDSSCALAIRSVSQRGCSPKNYEELDADPNRGYRRMKIEHPITYNPT